jgi:ribosomal protein L23
MTPEFELVQTEKGYLTQTHNTYLLKFADRQYKPNKIEVSKLLKAQGLNPIKITVLNTYKKKKRRGKKSGLITMPSTKKYYVRLKTGETIQAQEETTQAK